MLKTLKKFLKKFNFVKGICTVCGEQTKFKLFFTISIVFSTRLFHMPSFFAPRESFICINCNSNARNRHLAKVLSDTYKINTPYSLKKFAHTKPKLKIYEPQASGSIHNVLKNLDGYVCSEFFKDTQLGKLSKNGILCEDLQNLTFHDNSFDVVITQDVLEHVRDPKQALREIYRILKPSGYHIFTIPYNFIRKTRKRIALNEKKDTYLLPKKFHGDSIRDGLVYTEFGKDFLSFVDLRNTTTKNVYKDGIWNKKHRFYLSNVFIAQKNR